MDVYRNYVHNLSAIPETPKTVQSDRLDLEYQERPYLIVDLRDKDEFNANHIVSGNSFLFYTNVHVFLYLAHHYPAAMLSRCTNNESKELLIYVISFRENNSTYFFSVANIKNLSEAHKSSYTITNEKKKREEEPNVVKFVSLVQSNRCYGG